MKHAIFLLVCCSLPMLYAFLHGISPRFFARKNHQVIWPSHQSLHKQPQQSRIHRKGTFWSSILRFTSQDNTLDVSTTASPSVDAADEIYSAAEVSVDVPAEEEALHNILAEQSEFNSPSATTIEKKMPSVEIVEPPTFEGPIVDGLPHGYGKLTSSRGHILEGEFRAGNIINGKGTFVDSTGAVLEGEWKEGKLDGFAKVTYLDGTIQEGEFHNGELNGLGKVFHFSGSRYEGSFFNGMKYGFGVMTSYDGNVYTGEFVDDLRHGQGTLQYAGGDCYVGEWRDNKREGQGRFTSATGHVYEGTYKDGKLRGEATVTYPCGDSADATEELIEDSGLQHEHEDDRGYQRGACAFNDDTAKLFGANASDHSNRNHQPPGDQPSGDRSDDRGEHNQGSGSEHEQEDDRGYQRGACAFNDDTAKLFGANASDHSNRNHQPPGDQPLGDRSDDRGEHNQGSGYSGSEHEQEDDRGYQRGACSFNDDTAKLLGANASDHSNRNHQPPGDQPSGEREDMNTAKPFGVEANVPSKTSSQSSPQAWIQGLFGNMEPQNHFLDRKYFDLNATSCIIDNPAKTMANPLLGVNFTNVTETILAATVLTEYRAKPLLVTVRGVGGGKTRLFEEIWRYFIRNETVLPLAITFNCNTGIDNVEFFEKGDDIYRASERSAALSIICRMAHSFFGLKFKDITKTMRSNRRYLEDEFSAEELYVAFIQLMRDKLGAIEKVVLLVDETVQLQDILKEAYRGANDPLAELRKAVMDGTPGGALAMSSLEAVLKGFTNSKRSMQALSLPEVLDPEQIVTHWWKIPTGDPSLTFRFKLIAALLSDLPRALQLAMGFIDENRSNLSQGDISQKLLKDVEKGLVKRYPSATGRNLPSPALLYAMMFKEPYSLDDEAQKQVVGSVLTNVLDITEIQGVSIGGIPVTFSPRANLLLLSKCKPRESAFEPRFLLLLHDLIDSSIVLKPSDDIGDLLEDHVTLALAARVGVAMNAGKTVTLAQLLGLSGETWRVPALDCPHHLKPSMVKAWSRDVPRLCHRSNKDNTTLVKFKEELAGITVSEQAPLALRRGARQDGFDILVKEYDPSAPGKCRYVVADCKSKRVNQANEDAECKEAEPVEEVVFPKEGEQARKFCDAMGSEGAPVTYVYLTNHPQKQCVRSYKPVEGAWWVYGGRLELEKLMGPMWELHKTYRNALPDELPVPPVQTRSGVSTE